jgi:imidazoleglycerol phosphate dehydratase HisB
MVWWGAAEDCAIVLGQAFRQAIGERKGIKRYAVVMVVPIVGTWR